MIPDDNLQDEFFVAEEPAAWWETLAACGFIGIVAYLLGPFILAFFEVAGRMWVEIIGRYI